MNMMSENINELFTALAKAQATMKEAEKDQLGGFKKKYATLDSVWNACRESLTNNGLSIVQSVENIGDKMMLRTVLGHTSGQWLIGNMPIMAEKISPQGLGSALTYAKRYSLSALVGISSNEDDDGDAAEKQYAENQSKEILKNNRKNQEPINNANKNHLIDDEPTIDENQLSQIKKACQDLPKERLENMNKYISKTFGVDDYRFMKKKDFEFIVRSIAITINNNRMMANV